MNAALKVFKDARQALEKIGIPSPQRCDLLLLGYCSIKVESKEFGEKFIESMKEAGLEAESGIQYFWDRGVVQEFSVTVRL